MADGRVKEAVRHYKRALADREEVLGADHPAPWPAAPIWRTPATPPGG
jgi:Tetratricopeptide repeat